MKKILLTSLIFLSIAPQAFADLDCTDCKYIDEASRVIAYEDTSIEEESNILSKEDLEKIDKIVEDEKSEIKSQTIVFTIFVIIILILTLVVIRRVFQSLRHKKEREHH